MTHDDAGFWAFASKNCTGQTIDVASGVAEATFELWNGVDLLGLKLGRPITENTHLSLGWLFCHEIEHFSLGHFELSGQLALTETGHAERLGLVTRTTQKVSPIDHLPMEVRVSVEPCFELQADHEAIELMLGPYSKIGWPDLRCRVACVFAMMVLIEREDAKSGVSHKSHPKAATRIFQLLGHLSEMWSLPVRIGAASSLPPRTEIEAFSKQVILPAFGDALLLARAGGAISIVDDLGEPTDFFADIALANSERWSDTEEFKTVGGREWAQMYRANERIQKQLELDGWRPEE